MPVQLFTSVEGSVAGGIVVSISDQSSVGKGLQLYPFRPSLSRYHFYRLKIAASVANHSLTSHSNWNISAGSGRLDFHPQLIPGLSHEG